MTETQGVPDRPDLSAMDGYAQLRAIFDSDLPAPPISRTVGMSDFELDRGAVAVHLVVDPERHYNPIGTVHGGVISTLLDTAAACSVHSTLAAGESYTSLDLSVKFLRAVTGASGRLRCTGRVIQRGRRTALAEAQLVDGSGRLVAHATSSCMIFGA